MDWLMLARLCIGFTFVFAGFANLYYRQNKKEVISAKLPFANFILAIGIVTQVSAGFFLMINLLPLYAVYVLIAFTVVANFIFHDFWKASGDAFRLKLQGFNNSIAILGGLFALLFILS